MSIRKDLRKDQHDKNQSSLLKKKILMKAAALSQSKQKHKSIYNIVLYKSIFNTQVINKNDLLKKSCRLMICF